MCYKCCTCVILRASSNITCTIGDIAIAHSSLSLYCINAPPRHWGHVCIRNWVLRKLFDMFSVWKIIRYSQWMWYSHPITTYNLIKKFYVCINFNWHGNLWLDRSTMHPYLKITLCLHLWKQRGTVKSVKVLWVVLAQNGYGFFGFCKIDGVHNFFYCQTKFYGLI